MLTHLLGERLPRAEDRSRRGGDLKPHHIITCQINHLVVVPPGGELTYRLNGRPRPRGGERSRLGGELL